MAGGSAGICKFVAIGSCEREQRFPRFKKTYAPDAAEEVV